MTVSFPQGFRCTDEFHDIYPDVERQVLPLIKKKACKLRLFVPYLDMDDAIQEGRLALLSCLARFDYNKSKGDLMRYVSRALTNTYHCMLFEALAQCRMPHTVVMQDGEWVKVPRPPLSMDDLVNWEPEGDVPDAQQFIEHNELEEQAMVMKLKLINSLKGRDYDVFMCMVNPPVDLVTMVDNKGGDSDNPTNLDIAEYLGLSKNKVDWCLHKIRSEFTRMAKGEFSDLYGYHIKGGEWPMIHLSRTKGHDKELQREVIRTRRLDPKPLADSSQQPDFAQFATECGEAKHWGRWLDRYPWGVVLVLKRGTEHVTMVIEGRFNPNTGEVFGTSGAREKIPVDWYPELVRKLKATGENHEEG